jgi:hypothetical protein
MTLPRSVPARRLAAGGLLGFALALAAGCNTETPFIPIPPPFDGGGVLIPDGSADLSPLQKCQLTCNSDWSCDDSGTCVQPAPPADGGPGTGDGAGADAPGCTPGAPIGTGGMTCSYQCYGGWVCNTDTGHCVPPPPNCTGGPGNPGPDAGPPVDAGPVPTGGPVGPTGGTVSLLKFGVFGDVRPPSDGADSSYPVNIIGPIIRAIHAQSAQFIVATGDYMYSRTTSSVANQLDQLLGAEQSFTGGTIFHTMGNHECNGASNSNCPRLTETPNIRGFMSRLLPFSQTPYHSFTVQTSKGTAKFVSIAANAWDSTQEAWLRQTLAQSTTYTFVSRHEQTGDPDAPGAAPSDAIIAQYPVTLKMFGHAHEYRRISDNAVISGNGGANLRTQGTYYGYLIVEQHSNGDITVTAYDISTGMPVDTWAVTPGGRNAPLP